jgi:hypothetical protein
MSNAPSGRDAQPTTPAADTDEAAPTSPLEELVDRSARAHGAVDTFALPSGRRVQFEQRPDGERLVVQARGGRVELTVLLTDQGPRLVFESAELELRAARKVSVVCEDFEVRADHAVDVRAARVNLRAEKGNIDARANDHVVLVGEQVRLNCDAPDAVPPWMQKALGAQLVPAPEANVFLPAQEVVGDAALVEAYDADASTRR